MLAGEGGCNVSVGVRGNVELVASMLQANHDPELEKVWKLSDYRWWAGHGGVPAMEKELDKICNWFCATCHSLQPSSNAGRRCGDPDAMPPPGR